MDALSKLALTKYPSFDDTLAWSRECLQSAQKDAVREYFEKKLTLLESLSISEQREYFPPPPPSELPPGYRRIKPTVKPRATTLMGIELVIQGGRTVVEAAKEVGIPYETLRSAVTRYSPVKLPRSAFTRKKWRRARRLKIDFEL